MRPWIVCLATACASSSLLNVRGDEPKAKPAESDRAILASFSIAKKGESILLPVTTCSKTYQFVVDTGSSYTVFDDSLPLGKALGTIEAETSCGTTVVKSYHGPSARIGDGTRYTTEPKLELSQLNSVVYGVDFKKLREESDLEFHGMIGMEYLSRHIVLIDFDEGQLQFLKKLPESPGTPVSLWFGQGGLPHCDLEVEGAMKSSFLVDTGNLGYDSAPGHTFEQAVAKKKLNAAGTYFFGGVGCISSRRIGQAEAMTIAGLRIADPVLGDRKGENCGNLGTSFFSRFRVVFDFPNQRMYLTKGKEFDRKDRWDLTGSLIDWKDGKAIVRAVSPESAAAKAGLKVGDELTRIEGRTPANLTKERICDFFYEPGERRLRVSRAGESIEMTLVLRR